MNLTFKEASIISHSLGVNLLNAKKSSKKRDKKLPKEFYRNRFCAGESHDDLKTLKSLEIIGFMEQGVKINGGSDTLWHVTTLGIQYLRDHFEQLISNDITTKVAVCPKCKQYHLIASIDHFQSSKSTRLEFARMMNKGFQIKDTTTEDAKGNFGYC